jgi:hypothetical protein
MWTDSAKLAEMTLYFAKKSQQDPKFGKVKLVKLLAYSDFEGYARLGHPITGAMYQKLEYGPAPRDLPGTLESMQASGDLVVQSVPKGAYTQMRYIPKREPDTSVFTSEEIALMDEILERFKFYNAGQISDASHRDFAGWDLVEEFEEIPYRTALLVHDEPSTAVQSVGSEALSRLG